MASDSGFSEREGTVQGGWMRRFAKTAVAQTRRRAALRSNPHPCGFAGGFRKSAARACRAPFQPLPEKPLPRRTDGGGRFALAGRSFHPVQTHGLRWRGEGLRRRALTWRVRARARTCGKSTGESARRGFEPCRGTMPRTRRRCFFRMSGPRSPCAMSEAPMQPLAPPAPIRPAIAELSLPRPARNPYRHAPPASFR